MFTAPQNLQTVHPYTEYILNKSLDKPNIPVSFDRSQDRQDISHIQSLSSVSGFPPRRTVDLAMLVSGAFTPIHFPFSCFPFLGTNSPLGPV